MFFQGGPVSTGIHSMFQPEWWHTLVRIYQVIPELQIFVSFNKPDEAQSFYKEHLQIRTAFRAIKSSGFNIEDTHLTYMERVGKLFGLLSIAFVWAYRFGVFLDSIKPIKMKKHGRKANSFFKHGLTHLSNILSLSNIGKFRECCLFVSCT